MIVCHSSVRGNFFLGGTNDTHNSISLSVTDIEAAIKWYDQVDFSGLFFRHRNGELPEILDFTLPSKMLPTL